MIDEDEDGVWILGELVASARDLHRMGYIHINGNWLKRPSRGGSVDEIKRALKMKNVTEEIEQEIFNEAFSDLAKTMLNLIEKFKDYDQVDVMGNLMRTSLMFAIHSVVRIGESEEAIHDAVNMMITAAHERMAIDGEE